MNFWPRAASTAFLWGGLDLLIHDLANHNLLETGGTELIVVAGTLMTIVIWAVGHK